MKYTLVVANNAKLTSGRNFAIIRTLNAELSHSVQPGRWEKRVMLDWTAGNEEIGRFVTHNRCWNDVCCNDLIRCQVSQLPTFRLRVGVVAHDYVHENDEKTQNDQDEN